MKNNKKIRTLMILGFLTILSIVILVIFTYKARLSVSDINTNLQIDDIKFGMNEDELVRLWGNGEFHEGFGGLQEIIKIR
jgi:hypothetical protein